jgi:RND family efflux transporter MFP subunit
MMMKILSLAIACLFAFFAGCTKEPEQESTPEVRTDVRTALIRSGEIEETVSATGATAILRQAQLRSPITGIIVQFPFYNGDKITKGEPVASVRTRESEASLQGAEELLRSAKNDRQREEAGKALEIAKSTVTAISIRAPFDGILSNKTKNEMEVITEGEQCAVLIDPSSVIFLADVPSSSLGKIRQGERAQIRFKTKPGTVYQGAVHHTEPQLNPTDQTARVQIVFTDQHPDLKELLFGEASIIVGKREHVLLVPSSALLVDDETNTTSVMKVESDSLAVKCPVAVGARRDSLVEISSPLLSAGEAVITQGHYGLPDSTKVRVVR